MAFTQDASHGRAGYFSVVRWTVNGARPQLPVTGFLGRCGSVRQTGSDEASPSESLFVQSLQPHPIRCPQMSIGPACSPAWVDHLGICVWLKASSLVLHCWVRQGQGSVER